jgi:hypothetical protein
MGGRYSSRFFLHSFSNTRQCAFQYIWSLWFKEKDEETLVLINKFAYGALIHLFGLKKWTKVEMMEYFSFISVLKI